MGPGGLGENLTVESLDETRVCIGDLYECGDITFEVSQPRRPCAAIGRIWDRPDMVERVTQTGRTGWFMRVTHEGALARGAVLRRAARPYPDWTVECVFRLLTAPSPDAGLLRAVAACEALSPEWRERFARRAAG
jgi:MOSC domain-containing protein YiiM